MDHNQILEIIFRKKNKISEIENNDKDKNWFLLNRMFARQYPLNAYTFNSKSGDKMNGFEYWVSFFKSEKVLPKWLKLIFKKKSKEQEFLDFFEITQFEMNLLKREFSEDWKLVLEEYKNINNIK